MPFYSPEETHCFLYSASILSENIKHFQSSSILYLHKHNTIVLTGKGKQDLCWRMNEEEHKSPHKTLMYNTAWQKTFEKATEHISWLNKNLKSFMFLGIFVNILFSVFFILINFTKLNCNCPLPFKSVECSFFKKYKWSLLSNIIKTCH